MKKAALLILILLPSFALLAQKKQPKAEPFVIQGQLINCQEKWLIIFFKDKNSSALSDTIFLDSTGKFYLKTYKVKGPEVANIRHNDTQINDLFIAPGYNLTVNGNAKDFQTLTKTTTISGIGAEISYYRARLNSTLFKETTTQPYYELNAADLITYAGRERRWKDSIAHIVFDKTQNKDIYHTYSISDKNLSYFKEMVLLDNKFRELNFLVGHANDPLKRNRYTYEQMISIVRNNADRQTLDNLYKDEYLISEEYKSFIKGTYLSYLVILDYLRDSTLHNRKDYRLEKVNKVYKGKVREYVLYNSITYNIDMIKSLDEFSSYKKVFKPYLTTLSNPLYKKDILKRIAEKTAELINTRVGKPAPLFTLEDNKSAIHNLADFKGKVVYLDLWASWCGPCRAETPSLNVLYNKYKNDSRVVIISIAVSDGIKEWKKALEQDKPAWLQLLDKDGIVNKSYVANTIPQFIIIDKQGNIVDFDAPRPGSGKTLENILLSEMAK